MLRLPSTRNMGIVCRTYKNDEDVVKNKNKNNDADDDDEDDHENSTGTGTGAGAGAGSGGGGVKRFCTIMEKLERVKRIAIEEGADGKKWVDRARGLANPSTTTHTTAGGGCGGCGGGVGNKGH